MKIKLSLWLLAIATIPATGHAYLDPGTGSVLLQVILGGAAAVGVALKLFWHRIRVALGRGGRSETE